MYQQDIYLNGGVLLHNLAKLRDGKDDEIIKELQTVDYPYPEQDVINKLCQGHLLDVGGEYNRSLFTTPTPNAPIRIIHYAAIVEWWKRDLVQKHIKGAIDGKPI